MKKKLAIAVLAGMAALAICLAGCAGGGAEAASDEVDASAFVGQWQLVGMIDDEEGETTQDDIEMLAALGLYAYMDPNDDGTAVFNLFGEEMEGSWEAADAASGSVTFEDQAVGMTLAGGTLTLAQDGTSMDFQQNAYEMGEGADLGSLIDMAQDEEAAEGSAQ